MTAELNQLELMEALSEKHSHFGHPARKSEVVAFLFEKEQQAQLLGLSLQRFDDIKIEKLRKELDVRLTEADEVTIDSAERTAESTKLSLQDRFFQLRESSRPPSEIFPILTGEFAGQLETRTEILLAKYASLFSSETVPDSNELRSIETLFAASPQRSFSETSFTSFVQSIYKQPDSIVSKETKARIEEKFKIAPNSILTGSELAEATHAKTDDGKFAHNSIQSGFEFRPGIKTFVEDSGRASLAIDGAARSEPIHISPEILADSSALAELANFALIRQAIYDELNQSTNLFG
ncbi:MAG: hypothetical protein AAF483_29720, partial [Planctomycetota bacterium]